MTNRNFVKVSFHKHAIRVRFSRLSLWKLGMILILSSALWALCHKADGGLFDAFSTSNAGDTEEMHTYTVADGLIGPIVSTIFQDSRGILWFGSKSGGISRFDGDTFEQFRLRNNLASGITQQILEDLGDDLASGITQQILEDRWGRIWFLTRLPAEPEGPLSYFNGTHIETVGVATCMTLDRDGDIWAANDRELMHYRGTYASAYTEKSDRGKGTKVVPIKLTYQFPKTADARINVLFQSKDGTFWLGGSATGSILLLSFDPDVGFKNEVADIAKPPPVLASTDGTFAIHDIAQGPYGVDYLWFAGHNFLLRFDGGKLYQVLPNSQIEDQTDIQTTDTDDIGLHHDRFRGHIWFSDRGRVRWWSRNDLQLYPEGSRELFGTLKMQDTLSDLWFATPTGAYQYNRNYRVSRRSRRDKTYTVEDGLGSDNIQTIFEAEDGKIWFGHDNGVTVFNPQSAFVNFKTRSVIGSNSVRRIDYPWFSILGGTAYFEDFDGFLYQQTLRPEYAESDAKSEKDMSLAEVEVAPKSVKSADRRTEIVGFFKTDWLTWLINKPEYTPTETLYTFFLKFDSEFKQLTIRVQTEKERNSHPEVVISSPHDPYIAFGGWLFKPYSDRLDYSPEDRTYIHSYGLKWLSPDGTRTFEFQSASQFEDIPKIKHGPSAIVDMHTDPDGKIWCYREDGTIQSYLNLDAKDIPKNVMFEHVPMTHIKPLRLPNPKVTSGESSENTVPKWFFNSEEKQIVYWDIEKPGEPTIIEGSFNAPPIAIWESADAAETTFIFSDRLKKYRGTQLIHEEDVRIAEVRAALLTKAQVLWIATKQGAVRYDGTTLKTYGLEDGFLVNDLRNVHEDTIGHIWFATWGGGAVRYDEETFSPVTTKDGLAHNSISDIHQSSDGYIWFATEGGVTRYTPMDGALPFCNITAVKANETYADIPATGFAFPSHVNDITFNFEGINPLRLRHHLTYEFKLLGLGANDWTRGSTQTPTTHLLQDTVTQTFATSTSTAPSTSQGPSVTYQGLKPGNYTFLVKTYRKGWPYTSAPAAVNFTIATPFWTQWRNYLPYLVLIGLLITIVPYLLARLLVNRRRVARLHAERQQREEAEMQQLRAELEEARNMQTALLPTEVPEVEGLDVAGMSLPATQVGGDFYDYLNAGEKHLVIAVADAAGKGLRGALNAVLTNGMLNEIVQIQYSADVILTNLNASLVPRLYGRTFIALNLAIIDTENAHILYANAGQPYPILKRENTLVEIETTELPLGGMKRTEYGQEQLELAPGDTYIFYTDGVIEALNSEEEMYGTERLKSVLTEAPQHLSAEEIIQSIFKDIQAFVQTAEQYDDITIVVVRYQPTTQ